MLGDEVPPMPFSLRQKVSTFTCERMEVPIQAYLIHLIAHDERLFKMGRRAAIKVFDATLFATRRDQTLRSIGLSQSAQTSI